MRKIADMLASVFESPQVLRTVSAQRVMKHWPEVVGPILAAQSEPDLYEDGTLWVTVMGSAWGQEIRMRQDQILFRLNELAERDGLFTQIRVTQRGRKEEIR